MIWLKRHREQRMRDADLAVLRAIEMLKPGYASGFPIMRLSYLGPGRVYPALARLEASGRITREWTGPSEPHRVVYSIADVEVAS